MKKKMKLQDDSTTIPGATGPFYAPRDAKTNKAIPTDGRCQCGSDKNHIENGDLPGELIRCCDACGKMISSVRPIGLE